MAVPIATLVVQNKQTGRNGSKLAVFPQIFADFYTFSRFLELQHLEAKIFAENPHEPAPADFHRNPHKTADIRRNPFPI